MLVPIEIEKRDDELQVYEYHLMFWGEVKNQDKRWIERDLGIMETDFWFASAAKRSGFKDALRACADAHNCIIAFAEHEGFEVRLRTVARMTMTLPDGRAFPYEYDFGYAYDPESAEYMFEDGNYSCDCNRSAFLGRAGHDVAKMDCGDEIEISDFRVTKET